MLEVRDLSFRHKRDSREILQGITFTAELGEIVTILGPNGSGKTTLLKCILGVWSPYRGEILFSGKSLLKKSPSQLAKIFSFVPQDHELSFSFKVIDIVLMGRARNLGLFSCPSSRDEEIASKVMKLINIGHLKEKNYTQISGGERQLVLIARALVQETPVIILDEPTAHLDFKNQIDVLRTIRKITKEKSKIALLTLHDPNLASLFSDKIILLNSGKKIAEGKPSEILSEELIKSVYTIEVRKITVDRNSLIFPLNT